MRSSIHMIAVGLVLISMISCTSQRHASQPSAAEILQTASDLPTSVLQYDGIRTDEAVGRWEERANVLELLPDHRYRLRLDDATRRNDAELARFEGQGRWRMNGSHATGSGPGFVLLQWPGASPSEGLCAMAGHSDGRPFLVLTGSPFFRTDDDMPSSARSP